MSTTIFSKIQKPFYFIKISYKHMSWHLLALTISPSNNKKYYYVLINNKTKKT